MAWEGNGNASTNRDLKKACEAYETQISKKGKRKIEDLEDVVIEEEEQMDFQDLKMEWIGYRTQAQRQSEPCNLLDLKVKCGIWRPC